MLNELTSILASIQKFMVRVSRYLDQIESSRYDHHLIGIGTYETVPHTSKTTKAFPPKVSHSVPFHLYDHYKTITPPTTTTPYHIVPINDDVRLVEQEAKVERLESKMR